MAKRKSGKVASKPLVVLNDDGQPIVEIQDPAKAKRKAPLAKRPEAAVAKATPEPKVQGGPTTLRVIGTTDHQGDGSPKNPRFILGSPVYHGRRPVAIGLAPRFHMVDGHKIKNQVQDALDLKGKASLRGSVVLVGRTDAKAWATKAAEAFAPKGGTPLPIFETEVLPR